MAFLKRALSFLFLFIAFLALSVAAWGKKDKGLLDDDDVPKMPTGKEAAELGLQGFREMGAAMDPAMIAQLMEDMKDPEIIAEVQKLMSDKKFKKEMEKMTESVDFKAAMKEVEGLMQDPESLLAAQRQAQAYMRQLEMQQRQQENRFHADNRAQQARRA